MKSSGCGVSLTINALTPDAWNSRPAPKLDFIMMSIFGSHHKTLAEFEELIHQGV
jgi:hypothetical protein